MVGQRTRDLAVEVVDLEDLQGGPGDDEGRCRAPDFLLEIKELHLAADFSLSILGVFLEATNNLKIWIETENQGFTDSLP